MTHISGHKNGQVSIGSRPDTRLEARQEDLVQIDGKPVHKKAAAVFEEMKKAAAKDGVQLQVVSGYRSDEEQAAVFAKYGPGRAARPGSSTHRTGLAIDIGPASAYGWLAENAKKFGFAKTVAHEPWHYELTGVTNGGEATDYSGSTPASSGSGASSGGGDSSAVSGGGSPSNLGLGGAGGSGGGASGGAGPSGGGAPSAAGGSSGGTMSDILRRQEDERKRKEADRRAAQGDRTVSTMARASRGQGVKKLVAALKSDPAIQAAFKNWDNLNNAEKLQVGQRISELMGEAFGFKPLTNLKFDPSLALPGQPGTLGIWSSDGEIGLSPAALANPATFLNTITHEQAHEMEEQRGIDSGKHKDGDNVYEIGDEIEEGFFGTVTAH